jgi:hypothetical protein
MYIMLSGLYTDICNSSVYVVLSDEPLMKNMLERMQMEAVITDFRLWHFHGGTGGIYY